MTYEEIIIEIKEVIDLIRPYIRRDGGDIEFIKFEEGIVTVRLSGACVGCGGFESTLREMVEDTLLERVPGVIGVEHEWPE
ncbi:MAG: NifU family protein [Candidatus Izemoplasmatales bacterium]|jgi:Fe-S cluster biogenesis protein NfuA|nr:NifU family protein [Candidatus Izemoplasmatales bacterium]NLF49167.1 NifU family protein [Acholeplasmataceae bacterium]MDD4355396.1 NifU family protein [Candidatus Izemoplasmatales bacterium]MDD4987428.1 NifU family protein [Candidatus Izemoplasmatales bacterium]MDD5601380.1 NifU family protein [Candidatus Izemoplasmatales bacterium]